MVNKILLKNEKIFFEIFPYNKIFFYENNTFHSETLNLRNVEIFKNFTLLPVLPPFSLLPNETFLIGNSILNQNHEENVLVRMLTEDGSSSMNLKK